jgi:hypothetical protein
LIAATENGDRGHQNGKPDTVTDAAALLAAFRQESLAAFDRNYWPPSLGITGRLAQEYALKAARLPTLVLNTPSAASTLEELSSRLPSLVDLSRRRIQGAQTYALQTRKAFDWLSRFRTLSGIVGGAAPVDAAAVKEGARRLMAQLSLTPLDMKNDIRDVLLADFQRWPRGKFEDESLPASGVLGLLQVVATLGK